MTETARLVVVISPVTTFYDAGWKTHVAAFRKLGLMSFGDTADTAVSRLKENFREFIHVHRNQGVLEDTLNGLDVRWHWADEYPEDGPEYEDTNRAEGPPEAVPVQRTRVESLVPDAVWTPASDLAMAA